MGLHARIRGYGLASPSWLLRAVAQSFALIGKVACGGESCGRAGGI